MNNNKREESGAVLCCTACCQGCKSEHFTEYGNNNDYHEISDPGLTNLAYTSTPMRHPLYTPSNIAVMDSCTDTGSDSVESGGALPDPEMFSLGVQTVAPSCVASIRQSSDMVMVTHQRQSSLV